MGVMPFPRRPLPLMARVRQKLEFVFLDRVEDAVRTAIGELPATRKAA